jgi:RNA polymerase sigma-70 factor (ECF subfamily)
MAAVDRTERGNLRFRILGACVVSFLVRQWAFALLRKRHLKGDGRVNLPATRDLTATSDLVELLRAARAGSQVALGQLLEHYRPYLLQIANTHLRESLQSKLGGSDLVQDTFLSAHRIFARFAGASPGEFQGWLMAILQYQMAANTRHYLRTDKRRIDRERSLDGLNHAAEAFVADDPSPSSIVNREEEAAQVQRALEALPEHYRQIVVWRQWEKLSFDEIALRLGRRVDAARMIWWRAVKKLAEEMDRG